MDDKYVAKGAWMSHYDEYGRFQQCRYYVGDWNGDAMDVHTQQWVDSVSYTHLISAVNELGCEISAFQIMPKLFYPMLLLLSSLITIMRGSDRTGA